MSDKIYLASFYFGKDKIGWSIVEKENGVYKSGSTDKNSFTSFLDSNQSNFMMCDYIVFNEGSQLFQKEIIKWFSKSKEVSYLSQEINPLNEIKVSELQAYNFFKEYKDCNLDKINNYIKIHKK